MDRWLALCLACLVALAACSNDVDPDEALQRGLAEQQAGNVEAAADAYLQVLEVDPKNTAALYNLGLLSQTTDDPDAAEAFYRSALDIDPRLEAALYNLAIVRADVGATQEAIDLYRRTIAVNGGNASAHFNLGLLLQQSGQQAAATQQLQAAISLDPALADRLTTTPIEPGDVEKAA